jgi:calmodulin
MSLNDDEIGEAKEAFKLFDRESSGAIDTTKIPTALRSLGFTPSISVIQEMQKDADPENLGTVKMPDFLRQVERAKKEAKTEQVNLNEIQHGISYFFDQNSLNTDSVDAMHLKRLLQTTGEKLSTEEMDEFFKELPPHVIKISQLKQTLK